MAKESRAFGSQRARKQHLTLGKGGVAGEVADLRSDVEEGFQNLENRASFAELDYIDITGGTVNAAGGDITIKGRNLLQGQTIDTIKLTQTGGAELDLFALKPGDSGITVVMTVGAGALAVTYNTSTKVLTIELAAAGSSDDAVATAINADAAQCNGHIRATSAAGGDFDAAQASQALTGGAGTYAENIVRVGGLECLPQNETGTTSTAKWSDTELKVTVPTLTGMAAGDFAQVTAMADGTRADPLTATLA